MIQVPRKIKCPCYSRIAFKCNSFLMLVAIMFVAIIFNLDMCLVFSLQFFQTWKLLSFSEPHWFSNTILLLPASHLWPVKSEEVGCVHVVEEIKTKQTQTPPPPPAKTPSSDPWQYTLGRCCCFTWVQALVYGCLLWASCLLRLCSTVLLHALFHAFFWV